MYDRYILNGYAPILTEIPEVAAGKCRTKVGDDNIRQPKPMDDVVEEFPCFLCCRLDERLILDPLGEFINSDINPSESIGGVLEWSNHVQSPACEWPRGGKSSVEPKLEHGSVWQKIGIPHTIGQAFQRLR